MKIKNSRCSKIEYLFVYWSFKNLKFLENKFLEKLINPGMCQTGM